MKAYGLPRNSDVSFPDVADIQSYGLKSSIGRLPGKGGDIRSISKSSASKRSIRRIFKRKARLEGKTACSEDCS